MTDAINIAQLVQGFYPVIWGGIAGLFIGGMTYANLRNKIEDTKGRVQTLETKSDAVNPILTEIKLDIREIKTTLKINKVNE